MPTHSDRNNGVKYIVGFALFVLLLLLGVGFVASGVLSPKTAADARYIDAQTQIMQARAVLELALQKELDALHVEFERNQYVQKLAQSAADFERAQTLKEEAVRGITLAVSSALATSIYGLSAALIVTVLAMGVMFVLGAFAFANRQIVESRIIQDSKIQAVSKREFYQWQSEQKQSLEQLETEQKTMRAAFEHQIELLQNQILMQAQQIEALQGELHSLTNQFDGSNGQKGLILFSRDQRARKN